MGIRLFEHNKTAYQKLEALFLTSRRAAVIHPTGTGKSYTAFALCEAHEDRPILWISPSDYIYKTQRENLKRSNPELTLSHVHFYTYTRLTLFTDAELKRIAEKQPAYIILDEFHRAGAAVWGQSVERLLDVCTEAKVLGLSATSIRYLDNCRDMADELFDGQVASELSLGDAIARGILPAPTYVASFYQFGEELERLQAQARNTGNEYLRMVLMNQIRQAKRLVVKQQCGLPEIFRKHIKQSDGHYIVFCSSEERLNLAMEECGDWFSKLTPRPMLHKYKVLSRYTGSRSAFDAFAADNTKDTLKLLFCVDMLNEGIHMEHISGVIMLRATESANVYYQQLGRALACAGSGEVVHGQTGASHPLIFDLVNNFENTSTGAMPEGVIYQLRNEAAAGNREIEFEIYDYILDLQKALTDIKATFEQSWAVSYQALTDFVKEQKRFPARKEAANGVRLGDWCSVQRAQYKRGILQSERVELLERLGFSWDLFEDAWSTNLHALNDYVTKNGGLPRSCDDRALYLWLSTQRRAKRDGTLTADHEAMLTALGVELEISYSDSRWEEQFTALETFLRINGRQPQGGEMQEQLPVGSWLYEQRRSQQNGTLTPERLARLSAIGIRFDERRERAFTENLQLLKAFKNEHGRLPLTTEVYKGFGLGAWCLRLREQYRSGELNQEQTLQLQTLDFDFRSARDVKSAENWENSFAKLKEYLNQHGVPPKSREMPALHRWIKKQKEAVKSGLISGDEKQKLMELGMF